MGKKEQLDRQVKEEQLGREDSWRNREGGAAGQGGAFGQAGKEEQFDKNGRRSTSKGGEASG
jgi:hypothetical protein